MPVLTVKVKVVKLVVTMVLTWVEYITPRFSNSKGARLACPRFNAEADAVLARTAMREVSVKRIFERCVRVLKYFDESCM